MKKFITIFAIALFTIVSLNAQPPKAPKQQFTEGDFTKFQIEVLTKSLRLEEQQIKPFAALYTQYAQQMNEFMPEQHHRRGGQGDPRKAPQGQGAKQGEMRGERAPKLTSAEIESRILKSFDMAEKSTALKREYYYKFKEILTPQQILRMYNTERRIREKIVSEANRRTETEE